MAEEPGRWIGQVLGRDRVQTANPLRYHTAMLRIGIIEIVVGSLCIILDLVVFIVGYTSVTYDDYLLSGYSLSAPGIWGGICVIIAGSLGIAYSSEADTCANAANFVMNVIAALASVSMMSVETLATLCPVVKNNNGQNGDCYSHYSLTSPHGTTAGLGFICFFLGITQSILCCKRSSPNEATIVQMTENSPVHDNPLPLRVVDGLPTPAPPRPNTPRERISGREPEVYCEEMIIEEIINAYAE
ncbi:uncharacterized protein LOC108950643 [Ciona intestinalis]